LHPKSFLSNPLSRFTATVTFIVVLVNGFALSVAVLSLLKSRRQTQERSETATRNMAEFLERDLDGTLKQIDLALVSVKTEADRRLALGQDGLDDYIQNIFTQIPFLDSIRTTSPQGDIVHGTLVDRGRRANLADRDYFVRCRRNPHSGLVISNPLISRFDGRPIVVLARRLEQPGPDGTPVFGGVVYATVHLERFASTLSLVNPGRKGSAALLGSDFSIIARNPPAGPQGPGPWTFQEVQDRVRAGQERETLLLPPPPQQPRGVLTFRRLGGQALYVVVGMDAEDYLAPWRKEALQATVLGFFFLLLTLSSASLLRSYWRRETEARLRKLIDGAQNALYQISEAAQVSADLQDLFRRIHAIIDELLPAKNFFLALYDERADVVSFPYFVDEKDPVPPPRRPAKGLTDLVLRKGKPLLLHHEDLQALIAKGELQVRGTQPLEWLGVPLVVNKRIIGVLAVETYTPEVRFTPRDRDLLQFVCTQVASSIERKRAEEERRRLETELHHIQKLESIGSLAGGVAHDMNNVLGAIFGIASFLQENHGSETPLGKSLDTILRAATRGRDLVKNLTDFARKGLEEPQPIDLNELVRHEVELLSHTTLQKVELQTDLAPGLPTILGDPSTVSNCLMNLAVNAMDAMPQGGRITFTTRRPQENWVELEVRDTGQGMPPEVLEKAVDPFFTTKPVGKGTGMGLPLVFGAMRAHGGTLELSSTVGKGTTVLLRFPTGGKAQAEPGPEKPGRAFRPLRILLVDDDELIQAATPLGLTQMGHRVKVAASGLEALEMLEGGLAVDVVILDQNMPGLTGEETLGRIRSLHASLPVLVSSGFPDAALEARLAHDTRVRILAKPYGVSDLARLLNEV
jgi:signal transduction histidine kinase